MSNNGCLTSEKGISSLDRNVPRLSVFLALIGKSSFGTSKLVYYTEVISIVSFIQSGDSSVKAVVSEVISIVSLVQRVLYRRSWHL